MFDLSKEAVGDTPEIACVEIMLAGLALFPSVMMTCAFLLQFVDTYSGISMF